MIYKRNTLRRANQKKHTRKKKGRRKKGKSKRDSNGDWKRLRENVDCRFSPEFCTDSQVNGTA